MRWSLRSLIALTAVATLVGCSDSSSGTTTTTRTTAPPATTAVASTQPADPASAEITSAFVTFFNGKDGDVDKKVALLENGEKYRTMIQDAAKDPQAQQLTALVRSVQQQSTTDCNALSVAPPCALVTFDLLVGAFPALVNHQSAAVKVGTAWKVSAKAWCDVVALGGASCPS